MVSIKTGIGLLVLLTGLIQAPLQADPIDIKLSFTPDLKNGLIVYEICASCHLPEGWGNKDGGYPQIAGQHKSVLIKQLLDIRSGYRDNPAMYPFVQQRTIGGYQSLADVVAYISTLPMTPEHRKGPWPPERKAYRAGEKMYQQNCAVCHGKNAEGNNRHSIPLLYGQHYPYLLRQVRHVKSGRRKVNPTMQTIIKTLTDSQLQQIIDYISYLPVPKDKLAPSVNWRNPDFN